MKQSAFHRWLAFLKPVLYAAVVAAILTIGGRAAGYFFAELNNTAAVLLWAIPLSVLVACVVVSCLHAVYSLYTGTARGAAAATNRSPAIRKARPRIRFQGWETVEAPPTTTRDATAPVMGRPWLTRATFANEADSSASDPIAHRVGARVEFYSASRERLLFAMDGRWSNASKTARVGIRAAEAKLIDLPPNGMPRSLDVVLKYDEDDECYGLNNETPVHAPSDWRDEQRKLDRGECAVKVMIRGADVDETFWFSLVNRGSGQKARIIPLDLHQQSMASGSPQT